MLAYLTTRRYLREAWLRGLVRGAIRLHEADRNGATITDEREALADHLEHCADADEVGQW